LGQFTPHFLSQVFLHLHKGFSSSFTSGTFPVGVRVLTSLAYFCGSSSLFKYLSTSHSESSSSYAGAGAFIQAFDLNLKKNDFSHSQTQSAPHSSSQSSSSSSFLGNPGAGTY